MFSFLLIAVISILCLFFLVQIIYLVLKSHKRKPEVAEAYIVGMKGEAMSDINGSSGRVFVNGAIWEATSKTGKISKDDKVTIIGIEGLELIVEKRN
jgi:membrane-bound ClpP family serine protease